MPPYIYPSLKCINLSTSKSSTPNSNNKTLISGNHLCSPTPTFGPAPNQIVRQTSSDSSNASVTYAIVSTAQPVCSWLMRASVKC